MQRVIPHLWFDSQAKEAVDFYVGVFPDSKIVHANVLKNTPSGDCDFLHFELAGQLFMAISAGPYFKLNQSISFFVNFDPSTDKNAKAHLDQMWEKLSEVGKVMMDLGKYPFSEHYGWVEDKYGVSWQLILTNPNGEPRPMIVPCTLFVGDSYGKAEDAVKFYTETFKDSKIGNLQRYPNSTLMFADFKLGQQWFAAMDGPGEHAFAFNEAVSFLVECDDQVEIDRLWEKMSAVPESEQCGWIKDKFGVSWQISSARLHEMMNTADESQLDRVTQAFLPMKKFDLEILEKAYRG